MRDVLEVPPDLVAPAGEWFHAHQRIAAGRMAAVDAEGPLEASEAPVARARFQLRLAGRRQLGIARQRLRDLAAFRAASRAPARVALVDAALFEGESPLACGLGILREQQHAAGALVQAMQRPEPGAQLVAQQHEGGALLVGVQRAGMDEQAGRLVDTDQVFVLVKNAEGGSGHAVTRIVG
jgi:hypothetical protein